MERLGWLWDGRRWWPPIAGGSEGAEGGGDTGGGGDGSAAPDAGSAAPSDAGAAGTAAGGPGGAGSGDQDSPGDRTRDDRGDLNVALNKERAAKRKLEQQLQEYQRKERELAEAEALKRGEHEKVLNESRAAWEAEKAQLQATLQRHETDRQIQAYVSEKHPLYLADLQDILPICRDELGGQPDDDDGRKSTIRKVVDGFVQRHPKATDGRGAPAGNARGQSPPADVFANYPELKPLYGSTP